MSLDLALSLCPLLWMIYAVKWVGWISSERTSSTRLLTDGDANVITVIKGLPVQRERLSVAFKDTKSPGLLIQIPGSGSGQPHTFQIPDSEATW